MAAFRNQHFVPEFYLKLFANPDGKSIGVFNLKQAHYAPRARISGLASKSWFYGEDGDVERTFGPIEGRAARILSTILATDRLPPRMSADFVGLLTFVSLQRQRTEAALDEMHERTDRYMKALLRHQLAGSELANKLDLVKIRHGAALYDSLLGSHLGIPLLYDLRAKLIDNRSGRAFHLSDAPVVFHNRLYEVTGMPCEGYSDVGLQIVVPIGPWRAMLLYDPTSYRVGSLASAVVRLVNPAHADAVNDLQWEAAHRNVFASPATGPDELTAAAARRALRDGDRRVVLNEEVRRDDRLEKRVAIGMGRTPSTVRLDLPFVRMLRARPPVWDGRSESPSRDPEWAHFVTALAGAVLDERLDYLEFVRRTQFPLGAPRRPNR